MFEAILHHLGRATDSKSRTLFGSHAPDHGAECRADVDELERRLYRLDEAIRLQLEINDTVKARLDLLTEKPTGPFDFLPPKT